MTEKAQLNPLLKLALDFGPLLLFFVVNWKLNIFYATGVFMATVPITLAVSYALIRRLPIMAVFTAIIVFVFGGLTLYLGDQTFFMMKPTIIYLLFAGILITGLLLKKPLLEIAFDQMFPLNEEGWRKLTIRWTLFFLAAAVMNEVARRELSPDSWVTFKVFGMPAVIFVFAMLQLPLMNKYAAPPQEPES